MTITLAKGQAVSLRKTENDLSEVTIGLGWDLPKKTGLLSRMFSTKGGEYDLDVVAILLDERGKAALPNGDLSGSDVVYYNSAHHPSGDIWLTGDNRSGAGDGDDEQIVVRLNRLHRRYARIAFIVQIYEGAKRGQDFGSVENAFIRAVDGRGREMARYDISARSECASMRSLTFAELERSGEAWVFRAIGRAHRTDSFVEILRQDYI